MSASTIETAPQRASLSTALAIIGGVIGACLGAFLLGMFALLSLAAVAPSPGMTLLAGLGIVVTVGLLAYVATRSRTFALTIGAAMLLVAIVILSMPAASLGSDTSPWGMVQAGCQVFLTPAAGAACLVTGIGRRATRQ